MRRNKNLEILTLREGSWAIEGAARDIESAEKTAMQFMARAGVMGVRVVKESLKDIRNPAPGDILFEKLRATGGGDQIAVGEIGNTPPVCEDVEELFHGAGRKTINRLFRAYLDKQGVTPTEVMHNAREMKRAMDFQSMLPSAVARVAQLQSRGEDGGATGARRDALYGFVEKISERAKNAESKKLPSIEKDGINESIERINKAANGEAPGYLFRVAASRDLVGKRNWWDKFATSVGWAEACESDPALANLDWFISDALSNAEVLQDLLGEQDSLAGALITLMEIADGVREINEEKAGNPENIEATALKINKLFRKAKLPESKLAVMDRVCRQLQGSGALTKDKEDEPKVFREMLQKLIPGTELVGGPEMAEAITHRQSHIINKGGEGGLKAATASVLPALRDPGRKAGYLLALFESDLGRSILKDEIEHHLNGLFMTPASVNQIVRSSVAPNKKMEKVTSIFYRIQNSNLPDARKQQLTQHLDELLATYIVDGRILDRVDDPDKPLHIRAFMLVSMCQPEMLPDGKASKLAREIIVKHLRRPNFETELVAQVPDPAKKEKILRDFHVQLQRSGFFG
ncbi:MAG: hypothetical protein JJ959_05970 [Nisaea sp.]|uniref:hypothetical protein n=1 Tax=Nisaea sp. TaxID=2024842 RepID=UPI001B1A3151|nr:hypothetical protein [Nisaea sp.]MBO6560062.1 hypothetical protein [Nisaea sp.]